MRAPSPYHSTPDLVVRALIEARRLIASPGAWWRNSYQGNRGQRCLEQALRDAARGDRYLTQDLMRVMRWVVGIQHAYSGGSERVGFGRQPSPIRSLFDWNDVPGRTQEDVLEALDAGIERAEWIMTPNEVLA